MAFPDKVQAILDDIGEVAVEVACGIEDYREFVGVYAVRTEKVINFENRFPNLRDRDLVFRVIRFRVRAMLIEQDINVGPDDLIELQQIYLPSQSDVEFVLEIWQVASDSLQSPRFVEIPV
jgi:hypothetical protein